MVSNVSIASVVYLIFNQCKQSDSELANADKIIEYIKNNFDYDNEEVNQLQFSILFDLLKKEGKYNNNFLTKDDFEKVFKKWIPTVQIQNEQSLNDDSSFHEAIFNSTRNRLSRSLTNLKRQLDIDQRHHYCDIWNHWTCDSPSNNENVYEHCQNGIDDNLESRDDSVSPHEDPFKIPLNVIKSTPLKKNFSHSHGIGFLQQPNLRYIKQFKDFEYSYSDTEALSKYDGSLFEGESSDNIDFDRNYRLHRKRHRSNIVGQRAAEELDSRDLISQIRQIKFKNSQLVEINERLQTQLEIAEENIRNLNTKYMDLEKRNRHFTNIIDENQQLIGEIDDIRKCVESETELKRRIQSEKIMTESELTAAKEYIQSLIDKLTVLDAGLEEKDNIILNLKSMIANQEEFCLKLQDLNSEKDEELQKNHLGIRELTDAICEYEEKINIISKQKEDLEVKYNLDMNKKLLLPTSDHMNTMAFQDRECGETTRDNKLRCTTQSEFKANLLENSPWSIKLELATELIDSPGDSPLCEKLHFNEEFFNSSSDDSSFQMLNSLMTMITSLRFTLGEYREQLESAKRNIKTNEHFSDEISLSYLSCLTDSISLLSLCMEKATNCQQKFDETFNLLMKRISILRNEKKTLASKNEKLLLQLNESSSTVESTVSEKLCFLEEQLRKERLLCIKLEREMVELKTLPQDHLDPARCLHCRKSNQEMNSGDEMSKRDMEILNLAQEFHESDSRFYFRRRYTVGDNYFDSMNNNNSFVNAKSRSSASLRNLNKIDNQNDCMSNKDLDLSPDREEIDHEIGMYRNYNMSTDDLWSGPRYKISRTNTLDIDIEGLIENSWLEPPSKLEERRASVFVQNDLNSFQPKDMDTTDSSNILTGNNRENEVKIRPRNRSSSYSSSNDTSDANSLDSREERKKLAQQLECRTVRMQSRSPAMTLLNSSLIMDDLKAATPTISDLEQVHVFDDQSSVMDTLGHNEAFTSRSCSPNHKSELHSPNIANNEISSFSKTEPSNQRKQSVVLNTFILSDLDSVDAGNYNLPSDGKSEVPSISIMEPSNTDSENISNNNKVSKNKDQIDMVPNERAAKSQHESRDSNTDSETPFLQTSLNRSTLSLSANSVTGDEMKRSHSASQLKPRRLVRPHTIAGITANLLQSANQEFYDEPPANGDTTDIQEAMDILNENSKSLILFSPEELEIKFSESLLMYRTDRPTVCERAMDANNKCNKALTNVEQEFSILRHLIKNMSLSGDQPCDLVPRIRTSINVLEKCVEYLSAKSEILGSVHQEIKLSCLVDVIQEYSSILQKQKENHVRELEELKNSIGSLNEMGSNNPTDQARPKRSFLSGKDAKTRFQIVAHNTVTKTAILRQFSNAAQKLHDLSATPEASPQDSVKHDTKTLASKSSSNQSRSTKEGVKGALDDNNLKSRKIGVSNFFPSTPTLDDGNENLKGLTPDSRLNTAQVLSEFRVQQNKFSSSLESLNDIINECESNSDEFDSVDTNVSRTTIIRNKITLFFFSLKIAICKITYVAIGVVVMIGLLLPWMLIAPDSDTPTFSIPLTRRRSHSFPDRSDSTDKPDQPSSASSSLFLSNINVLRHNQAAV